MRVWYLGPWLLNQVGRQGDRDVDFGGEALPRDGVGSKPRGELSLTEGAAGDAEHERHDLFLLRLDSEAVQAEKDVHGLEGHTLVSIYEGMVVRQGESIGGREGAKIGVGFVNETVARAVHRRLKEARISQAIRSAVGVDLVGVDGQDHGSAEPAGFVHLASSRMAFLYSFAPSA